ncbi:MAG TPA: alpha/beta fold hydrolase [Tepidisphaeraceae bacterium]|jgi:hypothetical protein|nr:alpha/beta fold hydrolase [Tepidisphaeraceae bacterium]
MAEYVILVLILLLAGAFAFVGTAALMARLLLWPPRMTDGKALYLLKRLSPTDIGIAYESITFTVRDDRSGRDMKFASWWMPASQPSTTTVVLLHGYADAKVGGIAWAPTLLGMGLNVLAVDLRAHGDSDGTQVTAGYFERHDLDAIVSQLKGMHAAASQSIVLFGVSLGSAVAIATADLRDDVSAVVMDSPFADYRAAIDVHARLLGAPGGIVARLAATIAEWMSGANYDKVRPVDLVARSKCPVLIIQGALDPFCDAECRAALAQACASAAAGSTQVVLDDVGHLAGLRDASEAYERAIRTFLKSST